MNDKKDHPEQPVAAERPKKKMGRPTRCTPDIIEEICDRLSVGEGLVSICKSEHLPARSRVCSWLTSDKTDPVYLDFQDRYTRARELGLDWHAEKMFEICDGAYVGKRIKRRMDKDGKIIREVETGDNVQRSHLMLETRKWILARLNPKKYGERKIVQGDNDADGITFTLDIGDKKVNED